MEIITGKQTKPQRVVIYAPEGIGKSTLASQAPNPLFADIESGTGSMDVARLPKPSSWVMFKEQLGVIRKDPMGFQTLVIDTADWAERLCIKYICDTGNKDSIEDFGYGKGFTKTEEEWGRFLDYLTEISDTCNMNIIVLAHAHLKKFEQPDEMGAYDRYEMKLSKKLAPLTKEWADAVLFINYETIVVEDDKTHVKKAQGGRRVIHTTHHVCWDAKNRHDLPQKLDFPKEGAWDQFGENFFFKSVTEVTKPAEKTAKYGTPVTELKKESPAPQETAPPQTTEPASTGRIAQPDSTAFPTALYDLMEANSVDEAEIRKVVGIKGYYPESTPVGNYEDSFVAGVLIGAWEQVFGMIKENRKAK